MSTTTRRETLIGLAVAVFGTAFVFLWFWLSAIAADYYWPEQAGGLFLWFVMAPVLLLGAWLNRKGVENA